MAERGRVSPSDGVAFSGPAAAQIAGVSYRQLDYWAREGFIIPTIPSRGRGRFRRYSTLDILALRVAGHLRIQGVGLGAIQRAVETLEEGAGANRVLTSYEFRVTNGRIFAIPHDGSSAIDVARGGQLVLAIELQMGAGPRKELSKAPGRRVGARLLDERMILKRRKRRTA